jgi:hypothetical protein
MGDAAWGMPHGRTPDLRPRGRLSGGLLTACRSRVRRPRGARASAQALRALPFFHSLKDICQKPQPLFHSSARSVPTIFTTSPRWKLS